MSTPTCPACGAKFAHSKAMECCTKCGLPDEVAGRGEQAVLAWQKEQMKKDGATKAQIKRTMRGERQRRRNKHGRKGVRS